MNRYNASSTAGKTSQQQKRHFFTSRADSMRLVVFALGAILTLRLFWLQIIRHDHYSKIAVAEHQKKYDIPASRGSLYFRDGENIVPAVLNSKVYTLYADPNLVKDSDEAADYISAVLKVDRTEIKQGLEAKNTSYSVLAKRLDKQTVDQLFQEKEKLIGINIIAVPQRVYPEGMLGSQILGFVNDEGKGQYGVEEALNQRLTGSPGILKAITDVRGVPLTADDKSNIAQAPKNGEDIVLTVDRNIQAKAEEALKSGLKKVGATKGSVVVIDPESGAVRAMANLPSYDPSKYFAVGSDAYERFRNRVVSDPYEAGSVIKVLTMAAGLDSGVIAAGSSFNNTGSVQVDDALIKNVLQDVNGVRTMTEILQYSLNTGVVHILSRLGGGAVNGQAREKFYTYLTEKLGFGENTGIEQAGETPGSLFGPKTVQGNNVRYANMSFGQGMNVTMIQVAAAFSAVVNGGNYYQPHLIEGVRNNDETLNNQAPQPVRTGVVTEGAAKTIREMTRTALNETPVIANKIKKGYQVGGKTGTSQTIDPETGKYRDDNAIGSYLGYGGDEKPRYVIMVRVDDAKLGSGQFAGSEAAAPIFAELSNWLIDYYSIKPR